jgi:hypothetical protein
MRWGKTWLRITWIGAALAIASGVVFAQNAVDLDGRRVDPFINNSAKVVVLVFLRRDCPVSSRYAPRIQQISKQFADRASFWLVYPDNSEKVQEIRKSVDEFGYKLPVLRDPDHALVKMARVQITPEVAVFDHNRELIYDGRIDDWYLDLSRARPAPTTHELRDAITAAAAQTKLEHKEVRGVGCYIADVE